MGSPYAKRIARAREEMARAGAAALLVGPSADLRYLTGYDAPLLERLTLLVLPREGDPRLVVPLLERPRAESAGAAAVASIEAWEETEDPFTRVRAAIGDRPDGTLCVSDRLWATFVLRLQESFAGARFGLASEVTRPLRLRKDPEETALLRRAGAIADSVATSLRDEKVAGRTEREVSRLIAERLVAGGCERVPFAIVGSGPNAASPHHEPGDRVIGPGDALVCDFGGTVSGYGSDITRTFFVGDPPPEFATVYEAVRAAQEAGVRAVRPGVPAEEVDAAARAVIAAAGYGERFIHRTGHGIGLEEHEDPYIVAGNALPLEAGMAFSVEPGIYLPGRFGVRIEDIVVVGARGVERLNEAPRDLAVIS